MRALLIIACAVVALPGLERIPDAAVAIAVADSAGDDPGAERIGACAAVLRVAEGRAEVVTLPEALPEGRDQATAVLPGGKRRPLTVLRRGAFAVLAAIDLRPGDRLEALATADSRALAVGDAAWTVGNAFGAIEIDGRPAASRGVVSGRYEIPADSPDVRGRRGAVLSRHRGEVFETDAAVNDGDQGGPVLDEDGRLIGLASLGVERQRRLGTAVPIHLVCADLGLEAPTSSPAGQRDPVLAALATAGAASAPALALVYLERPGGPGNPEGAPRPPEPRPGLPPFERERLDQAWAQYYHQQQVFYTDQPVCAVVVDAARGLLLTSASNLHGGARTGRVLDGADGVACTVHAVHRGLDLAVLRAEQALDLPAAVFAADDLPPGEPVAVVGRHRGGGSHTLTCGLVSASVRRRVQSPHPFHQLDAPANYGSLGGLVVRADGGVAGLIVLLGPQHNPQDSRPWQINSGVALFVDGRSLNAVLPGLLDGKSEERDLRIGLGVDADLRGEPGAIRAVIAGSAAERAGLRAGDIIRAVDGWRVREHLDVSRRLLGRGVGARVRLTVRRGDDDLELEAVLAVFDAGEDRAVDDAPPPAAPAAPPAKDEHEIP